jgi:hypothetical protein
MIPEFRRGRKFLAGLLNNAACEPGFQAQKSIHGIRCEIREEITSPHAIMRCSPVCSTRISTQGSLLPAARQQQTRDDGGWGEGDGTRGGGGEKMCNFAVVFAWDELQMMKVGIGY